jgi:hypothetical protein
MKNTKMKYLIASLALLFMPFLAYAQQNTLTSTTTAAAVTASTTLVQVASTTGINVNPNAGYNTAIYVDQELMTVIGINQTAAGTNGLVLTVARGQSGTRAAAHLSGAMVLAGRPQWFYPVDPPMGSCVLANVVVTPWVNTRNGAQWTCSAATLTWAPGWRNPLSSPATWIQTGTVASAAGAVTPSGPYFNISGALAITGFNIPVGFDTTLGGCFTANPTGIFTWTAAGNIATAGTVTAITTPVSFCWNTVSSKWIPSRLS